MPLAFTIRKHAGLLTAVAVAACSETGPKPELHSAVRSISIPTPKIRMSVPGVARAEVIIVDSSGNSHNAIVPEVRTSGPFTAKWDGVNSQLRAVDITATGAGAGWIFVTADGRSDSISVVAVPLEFKTLGLSGTGGGCAIAQDDSAWCWGSNLSGQMGTHTVARCTAAACPVSDGNPTPLLVDGARKYSQIAGASFSCTVNGAKGSCGRTCAITTDGALWCWGDGFSAPTLMSAGRSFSFVTVVGSRAPLNACGLSMDHEAFCFDGTAALPIADGMRFEALAVGPSHRCGVDANGDAFCWGSNIRGALGIGVVDSVPHPNPEKVSTTARFTSIAVGDNSSCALDTTGTLYCWGFDYVTNGVSPPPVCDKGTKSCQTTPRPVEGGRTYLSFSLAGPSANACAITSEGAADCWASYFNLSPIAIELAEKLVSVDTRFNASWAACGVSVARTAYCWSYKTQPGLGAGRLLDKVEQFPGVP